MKKLFFATIILIVFLSSACTKSDDLSNPTDLSGTSWISDNLGSSSYPTYMKLVFISKTTVQLWWKEYPDTTFGMDSSAAYNIKGSIITIIYADGTATGTIDGNTMTVVEAGETVQFKKQ